MPRVNECEDSICLSLNYHVKEVGGNSHAVILMKNGNQVHSQHTDKGTRSTIITIKRAFNVILLVNMPRLSNSK